ncbi:MAG: hypothetical protein DWQ30_25670 [Acidobacteria bacterium]|nr:MAG: hypothetical protein DWQ30_25670 [Acidobacteriota bacterium]
MTPFRGAFPLADRRRSAHRRIVWASVGFAGLAGCAHQSVLPSAAELEPPPAYAWQSELTAETGLAADELCAVLGGEEQRAAQERLLAGSWDLAAGPARFVAADARAREVGATLRPQVNAQLQVTRAAGGAFGAAAGIGGAGFGNSAVTTYQPAVAASWEVDVWGRLRSRRAAALADSAAALEDLRGLGVSLSASLAELSFGIAAERALLEVLERQRQSSQRFLELVELRFGQGFGAAQDIGRQKEQLLGLDGQIDLARGRLRGLLTQRAALLGELDPLAESDAGASAGIGEALSQAVEAPLPEIGVPAELVDQRPDVRSARRRLEAADRRLAAAVREWLPGLTITGTLFDFQRSLSDLFEDLFWQVVGSASQSVYQGGARAARIEQAQATADEALAAYAAALVGAVREVEGAVIALVSQRQLLDNLERRAEESGRVLELTRASYREGATDYLNVITALQATQSLEQQTVEAQRQQLAGRVRLCRALGLPSGAPREMFDFLRPARTSAEPAERAESETASLSAARGQEKR